MSKIFFDPSKSVSFQFLFEILWYESKKYYCAALLICFRIFTPVFCNVRTVDVKINIAMFFQNYEQKIFTCAVVLLFERCRSSGNSPKRKRNSLKTNQMKRNQIYLEKWILKVRRYFKIWLKNPSAVNYFNTLNFTGKRMG